MKKKNPGENQRNFLRSSCSLQQVQQAELTLEAGGINPDYLTALIHVLTALRKRLRSLCYSAQALPFYPHLLLFPNFLQ